MLELKFYCLGQTKYKDNDYVPEFKILADRYKPIEKPDDSLNTYYYIIFDITKYGKDIDNIYLEITYKNAIKIYNIIKKTYDTYIGELNDKP